MFIHLGDNILIQTKEVIVIIDSDLLNNSIILSEFVYLNNKNIVKISDGPVKSIIITENKIYFSPLSTVTLKRRAQYVSELEILGESEGE